MKGVCKTCSRPRKGYGKCWPCRMADPVFRAKERERMTRYVPVPRRTEKQQTLILRCLEEGAGTSRELADELGIPPRQVSAILSDLWKMGVVTRTGPHLNMRNSPFGIGAYLYEIKGRKEKP